MRTGIYFVNAFRAEPGRSSRLSFTPSPAALTLSFNNPKNPRPYSGIEKHLFIVPCFGWLPCLSSDGYPALSAALGRVACRRPRLGFLLALPATGGGRMCHPYFAKNHARLICSVASKPQRGHRHKLYMRGFSRSFGGLAES